MDKLFDEARGAFDGERRIEDFGRIHEKFVDEAPFVMVTHHVNPG